ncbi:inorganic phosphate transporter [Owenweeksia hongkongensis]|uniref:inorganic phosphate transporter n=1 Tax=Owenweeksia hongkongensis TaxID=253245 RepID=UPI003A8FD477
MDPYLLVVITLVLLAVADLIVGVSNDAVNFLNSAIGSKVAGRQTILIIAAAGVLFGALSSSGMMEIARKGIFNPEMFAFSDVMVIFVAVMVADIILLDVFNSLGLPTSTTVSIVFDLLGAAVAVAIWKSLESSSGFVGVAEAINISTATAIISGIFLSIGVAFSIGGIVQYLCRLWFSFKFEKHLKTHGVIFASIAISIITYFLLIKGAKGSSFLSKDVSNFVATHTLELMGVVFLISLLVIFILVKTVNAHPLKIVVFTGTFSLAMAFAGNDLVNFIGVPLAGYQSFNIWDGSGIAPDMFMMDQLGAKVQTPFVFLLLAGLIMVVTLWFSGKAQKVTETEVNLGRQDAGEERFKPNLLSRVIVGGALNMGSWMRTTLPAGAVRRMDVRFYKRIAEVSDYDRPAFDLVRASVNLIVASFLIALATSFKLPLSTTYVSFMVAMGTSLADKAWGQESAVYRVAGVLNVIGGWLITALMAFFTAGAFATGIYFGGPWVAILLGVLALAFFVNSNLRFNKKQKAETKLKAQEIDPEKQERLFEVLKEDIIKLLAFEDEVVDHAFKYIKKEKPKPVRKLNHAWKDFEAEADKLKKVVYKHVLKKSSHSEEYGVALLFNQHHIDDLKKNLSALVDLITEHEKNHQSLPEEDYVKIVLNLKPSYQAYDKLISEKLERDLLLNIDDLLRLKKETQEEMQDALNQLMVISSQKHISHKQAIVLSEYILLLKNLVAIKGRIVQNYQRGKDAEGSILDAIV